MDESKKLNIGTDWWSDDYLNRAGRTVLKNLKNDAGRISKEDLKKILAEEESNKKRPKVINKLNSMLFTTDAQTIEKKDEEATMAEQPNAAPAAKEKIFVATYKKENRTNGISMKELKKTFLKGVAVEVSEKEKDLIEGRYGKRFEFETEEAYKKRLEKEKLAKKKSEK